MSAVIGQHSLDTMHALQGYSVADKKELAGQSSFQSIKDRTAKEHPAKPITIDGEYTTHIPSEKPSSDKQSSYSDSLTISDEGKEKQSQEKEEKNALKQESKSNDYGQELTESEQKEVDELKLRDAEVRAHEAAHKAAAGSLSVSSASFEYETGPDNKKYAVGGEVSIDVSKVAGDPQATIAKAQQIRRAANAPAEPSGQDRKVAAQASQMEAEARKEVAALKSEESNNVSASKSESSAFVGVGENTEASSENSSDSENDIKVAKQSNLSPSQKFTGFYQNIQSLEAASNLSNFDYYA